jgi:hypothetical protein
MDQRTHALRPRERVALVALVLYALGLAFLLGPMIRTALGTEAQSIPDLAGPPAASVAAAKTPAGAPPPAAAVAVAGDVGDAVAADVGAVPELAAADQARASALMESDRHFRSIVGKTPYTIARVGPWTTSNGPWTAEKTPELLGVSFVVSFERAIGIADKAMPGAIYDVTEKRSPPYQQVTQRVDAVGVTNLMVLVDLRAGKVVNISPGLGSDVLSIEPPPGFKREVPRLSNEYPDPAERAALLTGGGSQ